MKFRIGDSVQVLDDTLSGVITKIEGNTISIETRDGFILDYEKGELLPEASSSKIKNDIFSGKTVTEVIKEKELPKKRTAIRKKLKERFQPTMEVDLHINQLVRSSRGMTNHDMLTLQLDTAKRKLEYAIKNRIQKIVFIHGVGEGVLKLELEYLLGRYSNVKQYDADYKKYGLGATEVYIYQNVRQNS